MYRRKRNNGWILTEVAVVLFLMIVFFISMISATATFKHLNFLTLKKQQCLAAGRAQLDSIVATGKPIEEKDFKRLWPDIEVVIDRNPAQGDWEGLSCCVVVTKTKVRKRYIETKLCRYYESPEEK